eukprot:6401906-Amphidinium_carterae.1
MLHRMVLLCFLPEGPRVKTIQRFAEIRLNYESKQSLHDVSHQLESAFKFLRGKATSGYYCSRSEAKYSPRHSALPELMPVLRTVLAVGISATAILGRTKKPKVLKML